MQDDDADKARQNLQHFNLTISRPEQDIQTVRPRDKFQPPTLSGEVARPWPSGSVYRFLNHKVPGSIPARSRMGDDGKIES